MLFQLIIGLLTTFPCVILHALGIVWMFKFLEDRLPKLLEKFNTINNVILIFWLFAAILCLHIIEISWWAIVYKLLDCFQDFETALYYSFSAYTTVGYGDVVLPHAMRLIGSIESCAALLLFGYSTAFFWGVVSRFLLERHRRIGILDRRIPEVKQSSSTLKK